jgi:hypothetical protein
MLPRTGRSSRSHGRKLGVVLLAIACCGGWLATGEPTLDPHRFHVAAAEPTADPQRPNFVLESLRGRIVFAAEAMARLHGAQSVPEAAERGLAIETPDGRLVPLLEDVRGRAFRADERLRKMHVELLVRHYAGSPIVQVVNLCEITPDGKYEVDYWCDVCAIAMFELKSCECCQGEIELRRRRVLEPAAPVKQ